MTRHAGNEPAETQPQTPLEELLYQRGIDKADAVGVVVDDDTATRTFGGRGLTRSFGIDIQTAKDGKQGLALIQSLAGRVAFVVTDVDMPEMIGPDMLKAAHGKGLLDNVPAVVMTGKIIENDKEIQEVTAGGIAQEVLEKPFDPDQLQAAIQHACQKVLDRMGKL